MSQVLVLVLVLASLVLILVLVGLVLVLACPVLVNITACTNVHSYLDVAMDGGICLHV